jgi:Putative zinc-finger
MNCDRAQLALSARMDGEHLGGRREADLDAHIEGCSACRAFARGSLRLRTTVRIRPADPVPDLVDRIVGSLEQAPARRRSAPRPRGDHHPRWRRAMPAAAALVAGAVIGSVIVGGPFRGADRSGISAEAVVRGVRAAAPGLESFRGSFEIVERGLSPEVPERRLEMRVAFLAPQRFRLEVDDRTEYPSPAWTPTDITYIEDMPATFLSGPTGCPAGLPPDACPPTRVTASTTSPYSLAAPIPADLVVPVGTFGSARGIRVLGTERLGDREVVRVESSFERAAPMFPFLRLGGTWRPFFGGDRVELLLDADSWLPVRITVFPVSSEARRDWELRFGMPVEPAGAPILDVRATSIRPGEPDPSLFEIPDVTTHTLDLPSLADRLGYRPAAPSFTGALQLETAMAPPEATGAPTSLLVYADGLDYLRVGERPGRPGAGAFGPVGADAARVTLDSGVAYYEPPGEGLGRRLAIFGEDTALFLETNLPRNELMAIASSMPVRGVEATGP